MSETPTDVLRASRALERELDAWAPTPELVERARDLIEKAVAAGALTWEEDEREQLQGVLERWTAALYRAGEHMRTPELAAFAGELPKLDPLDAEGALERVRAGRPIIGCRIESADLRALSGARDVRIVDSVLYGCTLRGAELADARILHSTLRDCDLSEASVPGVVATSSILFGGSIARLQAPGAIFSGTRLEHLRADEAQLGGASFAAATVSDVDAGGADLTGALLDLAVLQDVRFEDATLLGAIFTGGSVGGIDFASASLEQAIFSGVDVRGCNFERAILTGAYFEKAVGMEQARFTAGS